MAKFFTIQNNFTGGEVSTTVRGRTDLPRYNNSVKTMQNAIVKRQGGFTNRAGLQYVAAGIGTDVRLIPFVVDENNCYMVEISGTIGSQIRFYKNGAQILSGGLPYFIDNPYATVDEQEIRYAQNGQVLFLTHPSIPPQQLNYYGDTNWRMKAITFAEPPSIENGIFPFSDLTLSALTGTVNVTISGPSFLAADTGRQLVSGAGIGVFTYVSTTTGTMVVQSDFTSLTAANGSWQLTDSPQTTLTPSAVTGTITLTLGIAGWRGGDIGSYVRAGSTLAKITGFTSTTVVTARVIRDFASITALPAGAWALEQPSFSATFGYPTAIAFYQQRMALAATRLQPNTVWLSETGNVTSMNKYVNDADPIELTLTGTRFIRHLEATRALVAFGYDGEVSITGSNGPLTPTSIIAREDSHFGIGKAAPVRIGDDLIFVQRAGFKVLAYNYRFESDSYGATDVAAIAESLIDAPIKRLAYSQEPDAVVWVLLSNDKLLSFTYDKEQGVVGWARHPGSGVVVTINEIASGPMPDRGDGLPGDQLWVSTSRIMGSPAMVRVERYNPARLTDCSTYLTNGTPINVWTIPNIYVGAEIDILADGIPQPRQVATGTTLTLANARTATTLEIGLFVDMSVTLLPAEADLGMTAQSRESSVNRIDVLVNETLGLSLNGRVAPDQALNHVQFNVAPTPYTGWLRKEVLGWTRGQVDEATIGRQESTPVTVLACVRELTVN